MQVHQTPQRHTETPMPTHGALTWADFHAAGISVSSWARDRGFNPRLVYEILRGQRKCLRGESAQIAKELRMK